MLDPQSRPTRQGGHAEAGAADTICVPYPSPLDWAAYMRFFRVRAVIGVEQVTDVTYTRTIRVGETVGMLTISNDASKQMLEVTLRSDTGSDTDAVVHHLRRSLDLEADIGEITAHLSRDADLVPLIACGRLFVYRCIGIHSKPLCVLSWPAGDACRGGAAERPTRSTRRRPFRGTGTGLPHLPFPDAQEVLAADLSDMGMPGSRARTLKAVTEAYLSYSRTF
jgi:3-methyladenine DNA glycosylase/8-oxoguanine DNA glycosylase